MAAPVVERRIISGLRGVKPGVFTPRMLGEMVGRGSGVRYLATSAAGAAGVRRVDGTGAWSRSVMLGKGHSQVRIYGFGAQRRFNSNIASQVEALPPARRHLAIRLLATLGLFCVFVPLGFLLGSRREIRILLDAQNPPSDAETLTLVAPSPDDPAHEVNVTLTTHPLAQQLYADPKFTAARPHMKLPPAVRQHNFTGGTLLGPDKMPVPPLVFSTKDGTACVQMLYLGPSLCGHPGLVHGGMLATLLDEGLARCCFPGLPNKIAVTASLKVDYRKPCVAGQYVVLKAETVRFEGRKAWVKGRLETLPLDGTQGDVLVEAEALFIEPRNIARLAPLAGAVR